MRTLGATPISYAYRTTRLSKVAMLVLTLMLMLMLMYMLMFCVLCVCFLSLSFITFTATKEAYCQGNEHRERHADVYNKNTKFGSRYILILWNTSFSKYEIHIICRLCGQIVSVSCYTMIRIIYTFACIDMLYALYSFNTVTMIGDTFMMFIVVRDRCSCPLRL